MLSRPSIPQTSSWKNATIALRGEQAERPIWSKVLVVLLVLLLRFGLAHLPLARLVLEVSLSVGLIL